MASEFPDGQGLSEPLPDDLRQWLDERAADRGVSRATLLERLVDAYRLATESDVTLSDADDLETVVERLVDEQQTATDESLTAAREDVESQLEDVRRRVVQVKSEADAKAPADHSHEEFEKLDGLVNSGADLRGDVDALQSTVDDHEAEFEELTDAVEALDDKLTRVAHAVVQLRSAGSADDALDALKHEAAVHGIDRANCEACRESVNIALLTEPVCPHCETQFRGVEPASGFFGNSTLTGDRTGTKSDE